MTRKYVRKARPDINVSERTLKPPEAIHRGDLDEADRLIEERLKHGVFDYTTGKIEFTGDYVGRWFNEAVNGQQIYRAKKMGWLPVTLGMIRDPEQLGVYALNDSDHVVRGQRGEEHLMFMSRERNEQVAMAKTVENMRRMGSTQQAKAQIADLASHELGPEAAEFVDRHVIGEIKDSVETVERLEPE